ncbi:MAG: hypothetical protein GQ574_25200 [Crocinitomix sp.]|nr:hypothetical protein [Crocinitomix sp.]
MGLIVLATIACGVQKESYYDFIISNGKKIDGVFIPYIPLVPKTDSSQVIHHSMLIKDHSKFVFKKDGTCEVTRPTGAVEGGPTTMMLNRRYGIKNDTLYIRESGYFSTYLLSKNSDTLRVVEYGFSMSSMFVRTISN